MWLASLSCGFAAIILVPHAQAQLDPTRRDLLEFGYERPLQGHVPINAYGYYYLNRPDAIDGSVDIQAAITPVYVNGELGFHKLLGPNVDAGVRLDGGAYAFGYNEYSGQGRWLRDESFLGHGGGMAFGAYPLFNPGAEIPLNGVLEAGFHQLVYERYSDASHAFVLPKDQGVATVRAGLRFGGIEPNLYPDRALEESGWYQGSFRTRPGVYGFDGDRRVERDVHQVWGRAAFMYVFPDTHHRLTAELDAGTSTHSDRLSGYRIGGPFMLAAEFPLVLPGYDVGEIVAKNYVLVGASYSVPIDPAHQWNIGAGASTAHVAFVPGVEQAHKTNTGLSVELRYQPDDTGTWHAGLAYGRALDSERNGHRGASSVALVVEVDLEKWRRTH